MPQDAPSPLKQHDIRRRNGEKSLLQVPSSFLSLLTVNRVQLTYMGQADVDTLLGLPSDSRSR